MPLGLLLLLGPVFGFSPIFRGNDTTSEDVIDWIINRFDPVFPPDGPTPGEEIVDDALNPISDPVSDDSTDETDDTDEQPDVDDPDVGEPQDEPEVDEPEDDPSIDPNPDEDTTTGSGGVDADGDGMIDEDPQPEPPSPPVVDDPPITDPDEDFAEMPEYAEPPRLDAVDASGDEVLEVDGGRVTTLAVEADQDIDSIRLLELPEHGHASVNPDNTLSLVMSGSDYQGPLNLTYEVTYADGSVEVQTLELNVAKPTQDLGWGMGKHYMLEEDENGDVIVETGDDHRKVYLTEGENGLTKAEIAAMEGLDESAITNRWLIDHPEYGGSEDMALDTSLGISLWNAINPRGSEASNWLLFEKGYEYTDIGPIVTVLASGESELHPLHITSWGEGDRPVIDTRIKILHETNNIVFSDLTLTEGLIVITDSENYLLHNVEITDHELSLDSVDNFTIHDSQIHHVYNAEPTDPNLGWHPHLDRVSGLYATSTDGLLIEGSVFHHNGWAEDYLDADGQPPSMFSHNVYLQWDTTDVSFQNNIVSQGASFGAQFRGGAYIEDNVFLDNNAAFNILGGNYEGRGFVGNYSYVGDNVVTSGAHKEAEQIGALTMGIDDFGRDTGLVDNIVVHLANPDDPEEIAAKDFTHDGLRAADAIYNDTVVFNWVGERDLDEFDEVNQNIEGLNEEELFEVTIQRFAQDLLGDPDATIQDMMDYILTLPESEFSEDLTADDIIRYFQEGFGIEIDSDAPEVHRFVPNGIGDGVRWDNRINWNSEDVPDDGDDVALGGNFVQYGGTVRVGDLSLGDFGHLDVNYGLLAVDGDLSVGEAGANVDIEGAGQFFTNGYWDTDHLEINVEGGRFANMGVFEGTASITVTDGQALLAIGGADMYVGEGSNLYLDGTDGAAGFDGHTGETATLTIQEGGTLTFDADETGFETLSEFHSGVYEEGSDVISEVTLGGDLVIDASELDLQAGDSHMLIDVDQLEGVFDSFDIVGLGADLDATLIYDYEEDQLMLDIVEGTGLFSSVEMSEVLVHQHLEVKEPSAWDVLTQDQGTWEENARLMPEEETDDILGGLI